MNISYSDELLGFSRSFDSVTYLQFLTWVFTRAWPTRPLDADLWLVCQSANCHLWLTVVMVALIQMMMLCEAMLQLTDKMLCHCCT